MTEGLQQKLLDGLVKGLVAVLSGGGIATLSSSWVGASAFDSFKGNLTAQVSFPTEPLPPLLEAWSGRVLRESLTGLEGLRLVVLVVALLALVAHVVVRSSLDSVEDGSTGAPPAESARTRQLRRAYDRWHGVLTLALFLILAAVLWRAPSPTVLVVAFALLLIPGTLYLVLYAGDVRRPRFVPRFSWIACAMLLFTALLAAPRLYGERFFDVQMVQVLNEDGTQGGFAFWDRSSVHCTLAGQPDGAIFVNIQAAEGQWTPTGMPKPLRTLLANYQPPAKADAVANVEADDIVGDYFAAIEEPAPAEEED